MKALVVQQRLSAIILLIAMMLHVHGVPDAWLRLVLLGSALWHATVSIAVVLGDYAMPIGPRRATVAALALGALALFGLGTRSTIRAQAPVEPEAALTWYEVANLTSRCGGCHGPVAVDEAAFRAWAAQAPVREQLRSAHRVDEAEAARILAWLDQETE